MASTLMHKQHSLPPSSNFSEAFWDDRNKGVDIVMSRLRKSRDTCEEIRKIYELRASIEQDYGERLLKLAQSSRVGELEENTFAETLSRIPSALETTARAHIDLAQQLKDHLEAPLDGFLKDQKDLRRAQQQQIDNSKQLRSLHEADVARAKECYSNECNKLISLEQYLFSLQNNTRGAPSDDIVKIEKEIEEQKKMVAVSDQLYRRSIDNYNAVNEKWVDDWTTVANACQEMEVKRISYLRSTLWSFANMMTSTFSIDEECCDRIRTALEITDVQKDIQAFVQQYGTGNRIPAPLTYEALYQLPYNSGSSTSLLQTTALQSNSITGDSNKSLSVPIPQQDPSLESLHDSSNNSLRNITRAASDSFTLQKTQPAVATILTNPDEELKSVDRQLQQLEIQHNPQQPRTTTAPMTIENEQTMNENNQIASSPQQISTIGDANEDDLHGKKDSNDSGNANTRQQSSATDHSNGLVSTAFKEIEQILNNNNNSVAAPAATAAPTFKQELQSIPHEERERTREVSPSQKQEPTLVPLQQAMQTGESRPISIADDFSSGIYNALGLKDDGNRTSQFDLIGKEEDEKKSLTATGAVTSQPMDKPTITTTTAGTTGMNFETPIAVKFDSSLSQEKTPSIASSDIRSQKYAPTPNPAYHGQNTKVTKEKNDGRQVETMSASSNTKPQQPAAYEQEQNTENPSSIQPQSAEGLNVPSTMLAIAKGNNDDEDEDEEDEDADYQKRQIPRLPPKDEKWVISSIRRPQQLPVRSMNATVFDGAAASARNSMASPAPSTNAQMNKSTSQQQMDEQQHQQHQPKPHRPVVPLTIDIPNPVAGSNVQNAAQQVIQEGRRQSQMSPVQRKLSMSPPQQQQQQAAMMHGASNYMTQPPANMEVGNGGIRPAPWQDDLAADPMAMNSSNMGAVAGGAYTGNIVDGPQQAQPLMSNSYYNNGTINGLPSQQHTQLRHDLMLGPRASSLKIPESELQHQQQPSQLRQSYQMDDTVEPDTSNKKSFINGALAAGKTTKQSKQKEKEGSAVKTGRFSLGFFGGNKKEKKKEKEKRESEQHYAQQQQQQQQQQLRPLSQQPAQQLYQTAPREVSQTDLRSSFSGSGIGNTMASSQQGFGVQQQSSMPSNNGSKGSRYIGFAKAQWAFQATIEGEMSIDAEEVVGIIRKQMDGWWEAERIGPVGTGQKGLIPGNYMLDNQPPPQGTSVKHT